MRFKNYEYQSDFARHHFDRGFEKGMAEAKAEGRVWGAAKAILLVLGGRGIGVPPDVHARIVGCDDFDQLLEWAGRAAVVSTAAEIFD